MSGCPDDQISSKLTHYEA